MTTMPATESIISARSASSFDGRVRLRPWTRPSPPGAGDPHDRRRDPYRAVRRRGSDRPVAVLGPSRPLVCVDMPTRSATGRDRCGRRPPTASRSGRARWTRCCATASGSPWWSPTRRGCDATRLTLTEDRCAGHRRRRRRHEVARDGRRRGPSPPAAPRHHSSGSDCRPGRRVAATGWPTTTWSSPRSAGASAGVLRTST